MKLNKEQLLDLLCTSTYGSNWLEIKTLKSERHLDGDMEFDCYEDRWVSRLLNGGSIVCLDWYAAEDNEDGKPDRIVLKMEGIIKGVEIALEQYPMNVGRFLAGQGDYYDANNIIQCAMFGELVY